MILEGLGRTGGGKGLDELCGWIRVTKGCSISFNVRHGQIDEY